MIPKPNCWWFQNKMPLCIVETTDEELWAFSFACKGFRALIIFSLCWISYIEFSSYSTMKKTVTKAGWVLVKQSRATKEQVSDGVILNAVEHITSSIPVRSLFLHLPCHLSFCHLVMHARRGRWPCSSLCVCQANGYATSSKNKSMLPGRAQVTSEQQRQIIWLHCTSAPSNLLQ